MGLTEKEQADLDAALKRAQEFVLWSEAAKPATVAAVEFCGRAGFGNKKEVGSWVSIRPVKDDRTYLGVMLGDLPTGESFACYHPGEQRLRVFLDTNPAVWVPDLGRIVWGRESWWGVIESPEGLRKITDADIDNIWYVQALKALTAKAGTGERNDDAGHTSGPNDPE